MNTSAWGSVFTFELFQSVVSRLRLAEDRQEGDINGLPIQPVEQNPNKIA